MIKILIQYKYLFLVLVLLLTGLSLANIGSLKFNTDFSQYLPDNDPQYDFYKQVKLEIQDDESLLVIGIRNEETVFDKDFLEKVQLLTDSLKQIPEIKEVKGLTNLSFPMQSFLGVIKVPYLEINDSIPIKKYTTKIFKDFEVTRNFVNKDGTILLLLLEITPDLNTVQVEKVLRNIDDIRSKFPELDTYLWGKKYLKLALNEVVINETKSFIIWVFLFLIIALSLIFRKPKAILSSVILIIIALIIFVGGMALLGRPFGMMSNLFPTIILIVGISDIIHLAIKYNFERSSGKANKEAVYDTIHEIGWATFITSFTTAVGFLILYLSPMKALRDFGLEAGIAVMLTFGLTLLLVPVFFTDTTHHAQFSLNAKFEIFSDKLFHKLECIRNYPKLVLSFYGVLLIVSIFGIFSINTNNLQFSIPDNTELKKNYSFFEKNLEGSRTFELVMLAKGNHVLNEPNNLKSVGDIHDYLESLSYLHSVRSPILYYRAANSAYHPSDANSKPVTYDKVNIAKYEKLFKGLSSTNYLYNKGNTIYKFNARMKDLGRHVVESKNNEIISHLNTLIDTTMTQVRISGMDYLFDRAHEERIHNMLYGLLVAIIMVALTLAIIFKNTTMILLVLLLNLIPILISAGIMGFTNLELRSGTSIIFTIGFVIAVDDTIHLLSKFHWERKRGSSIEQAMEMAIKQCGKAILATSIILLGGFFILMRSDFEEIFTLGLLIGIVVIITFSVDLILAPILILKWFRKYL